MAIAEAVKTYQNYIGGEWRDAGNGALLEVHDPGNGELVYRAPNSPIEDSRAAIVERLGACATLAYPYGDTDGRVMAAARRAGYDLAAALPVRLKRPAPMGWPRLGIYPADVLWRFRLKVSRPVRAARVRLGGAALMEEPPS